MILAMKAGSLDQGFDSDRSLMREPLEATALRIKLGLLKCA